ncbi:MAG: YDG domain-containing protein, partial [Pelosinus sp.]|nr:YDG domain-containing protein [Pelosinus sp.]
MKISRKWRRAWSRPKPKFTISAIKTRLQRRKKTQVSGKGKTKPSIMQKFIRPAAVAAGLALSIMAHNPAYAMPANGQVVAGQGKIVQNGGNMAITQSTDKLSINWRSFNIANGEKVQFVQPGINSVALNRVIGNNASSIYGQLSANGKVFLINTNGILFSPTARVDTGALVASSLDMTDSDFMAGRYRFAKGSTTGSVINQGNITAADGGFVALLGEKAVNEGVIVANKGSVALGAGEQATLDMKGDGLINLAVSQASLNAQVENKNLIQADGGMVVMTAKVAGDLAGTVVNNSGVVRAQTIGERNGKIILDGGTGIITNSGTLSASGSNTAANGGSIMVNTSGMAVDNGITDVSGINGGTVAISAGHLLQSGTIKADGSNAGGTIAIQAGKIIQTASVNLSANGALGTGGSINVETDSSLLSSAQLSATGTSGGQIDVLGKDITLMAARADATGLSQGGQIHIGGDFQGVGNRKQADTVFVNSFTSLDASAKNNGNGGKIVVWSNANTQFYGTIQAKGGLASGDGGMMEVSGKNGYRFAGKADASAVNGKAGGLLLDPKNVIIGDATSANGIEIIGPDGSGSFGSSYETLTNGNILVTDTSYDAGSGHTNAGAVYLYQTGTGALISAVTGSHTDDKVGTTLYKLTNNGVETGNFLVRSSDWNSSAGAVTWGNGTTGFLNGGGIVSTTNSLIGDMAGDKVGSGGVSLLKDGNYLVLSSDWHNSAGAVTWGNSTTGFVNGSGIVSATNSLVGDTANDQVGSGGVTLLDNGNYIVSSSNWHGNKGAVTWGNGSTGRVGTVSAANSLVGSTANDNVGTFSILRNNANNSIVIYSSQWDNGSAVDAGFAALMNGATGKLADGTDGGIVTASNSLVGTQANDRVSSKGIITINNGNYIVNSWEWHNTATQLDPTLPGWTPTDFSALGAVTWGSGSTGAIGAVGIGNSLIGTVAGNPSGDAGVTVLGNNNYVVSSRRDNGGAATWVNGSNGYIYGSSSRGGTISSANSLVGTGDLNTVVALPNNNYIVASPYYNNGATSWLGALTWGNGSTGVIGTVSVDNSLVGMSQYERVGSSVFALANGNYVIVDKNWHSSHTALGDFVQDDPTGYGKVIWVDGSNGHIAGLNAIGGTTTAASGLAGSANGDKVGESGIVILDNNNYVVQSSNWSGTRGAVTWVNGTNGNVGSSSSPAAVISSANSLVGGNIGDNLGSSIVKLTGNNNYLVVAKDWNGGTGAVTWVNGTNGNIGGTASAAGVLSATNSLVGSVAGDHVGSKVETLTNGNYIVESPNWSSGAGAVSWVNGTNGNIGGTASSVGVLSSTNSLVGSAAGDHVSGTVKILTNNNYIVQSPDWNGGAGAVTWVNGTNGNIGGTASSAGAVSSTNSLVGSLAGDHVGSGITLLTNNDYVVQSSDWNGGAGAVTLVSNATGNIAGVVSSTNSLVGSAAGDNVGNGGITPLTNGNFVVNSPSWNNGRGAITWVKGTDGKLADGSGSGAYVSASNSLVGTADGDNIGDWGTIALANGNYISQSGLLNAGAGAITWGNGVSGTIGNISASNSYLGTAANATNGLWLGDYDSANNQVRINVPDLKKIVLWTPGSGGGSAATLADVAIFTTQAASDLIIDPSAITTALNAGTKVTIQANTDITVDKDVVSTAAGTGGNLTLQAGRNVNIKASVTTANGNLSIIANDSAADSNNRDSGTGGITLDSGKTINTGTGTVTMSLGTAGTVGNVTLNGSISAGTLDITGQASTIFGGTASIGGDINVRGNGSITLQGGNLSSASGNIILDSGSNGHFINNIGSSALQVADGKHWYVYSSSPLTDTKGGLSYNFKQYNTIYNGVVQGSGSGFIYSIAPTVTGSLVSTATKTYDGDTGGALLSPSNYSVSGAIDGDVVTLNNPANGTYDNKDKGVGKGVSVGGVTIAGAMDGSIPVYGYTLASSTVSGNIGVIDPRKVTYIVADAASTYGTLASLGAYTLGNVIAAEQGFVAGIVGAYSGSTPVTLTTKTNTGIYTEKVTGLTGSAAGNYEIDTIGNTTGTLTIAPKAITITPTAGQNMEYNGSIPVVANLTHGGASNLVTGDFFTGTMGLAGISKNAGSYAITGGTLGINDGNGGANYAITFTPSVQYTITPKTLTLSGLVVNNKPYDGTTAAAVNGTPSLNGIIGSDSVSVGGTVNAAFSDSNAGPSKAVTVTGLALTGGDKDNYTLSSTANATATINPKKITYSVADANSTYGDLATLGAGALSGVLTSDNSNVAGTVGAYSGSTPVTLTTKTNAGIYTEKVIGLTGSAAGNYEIDTIGNTTGTLTIAPKAITITPTAGQNMEYNGSIPV